MGYTGKMDLQPGCGCGGCLVLATYAVVSIILTRRELEMPWWGFLVALVFSPIVGALMSMLQDWIANR